MIGVWAWAGQAWAAKAVQAAEVIFMAVGTPPLPNGEPDLKYLEQASYEVGAAMKDASICGLGQTAYAAIESAIHRVGVLKS